MLGSSGRFALLKTLRSSLTRPAWPLGLFAVVQIADAVFTLSGVRRFGPSVEANPVLAFYMATWGVGVTLVGAKSIAMALAVTLAARSYDVALTVLTFIYLAAAIFPWTWLFLMRS